MELCDKLGGIPYHQNQIIFAVGLLNFTFLSQMELYENRQNAILRSPYFIIIYAANEPF